MKNLNQSPSIDQNHPVLKQSYAVYTPSMEEMITTIGNWIDQKVSGGYIYGPSRFGKSVTVKWYVRTVLEERFNNKLPMVVWSRPDTSMTEVEFWNLLLLEAKFRFQFPDKLKKKIQARFLFKQHLITIARSARQNYVVLIIDEAHEVTLKEWKWLLGLQNELDKDGFHLTVFSIGSHQLGYQPSFYSRIGNAHIAARFFAVSARFHGIRNIKELRFILNGYDIDSEWPEGTGISYLKYFAPSAFENKCRLADQADELWMAFEELLPLEMRSSTKKSVMELPMLHLAITVEQLLRQLENGKDWESTTSKINLLNIIKNTGFTLFMRLISAQE